MRKCREHCNETSINFFDLVKLFDRVPREPLWIILQRFGFPPKIITILKSIHKLLMSNLQLAQLLTFLVALPV